MALRADAGAPPDAFVRDVDRAVSVALPDARQAEVDRGVAFVDVGHGCLVWTAEFGMGRSTLLDAIAEHLRTLDRPKEAPLVVRLSTERRHGYRAGVRVPQGALLVSAIETDYRPGDELLPRALTALLSKQAASGEELDREITGVLRRAVRDRTLVLLADDLHECGNDALERVMRIVRCDGVRVVMLATAATSPFGLRRPHDVDVRQLSRLDPQAVLRVLAGAGSSNVAPHVASRLAQDLVGNPACIIQTAALLTSEQLTGTSLLPDPLPVAAATRAALDEGVEALSVRDRAVLLVAAVAVVDRLDVITAASAVGIMGLAREQLAAHLRLSAGRFEFVDPRLRALIHEDASLAERSTAHVALATAHADAGDDDLAAWHTALATLEGDPAVVPALLRLTQRHLERGDTEWAHAVAREAVGHASGQERIEACAVAGIAAVLSGHVHDGAHWLTHAARSGDIATRARTLLCLTVALNLTEGRIPDDVLERARADAAEVDGGEPGGARIRKQVAAGLTGAACLHLERGSPAVARGWLADALALVGASESGTDDATRFVGAWRQLYDNPARDEAGSAPPRSADDRAFGAVARAVALMRSDQSGAAARVLSSAAAELAPLPQRGRWFDGPERSVSALVESHMRVIQALVEMRAGDLSRAAVTLRDAAHRLPVGLVFGGLGVTLSRRIDMVGRGGIGATSAALLQVTPYATAAPVRLGILVDRALAASFKGEHAQAATLLELAAEREMREPGVVMTVPGLDAVETWAMAGRPADARRAIERLRSSPGASTDAVRAVALARAEMTLVSHEDVAAKAAAATSAARRLESAYERAKVELSIGRAMNRLGIKEAAFAHLMAAQDLFEESGAQAWAALVRSEGERVGKVGPGIGAAEVGTPVGGNAPQVNVGGDVTPPQGAPGEPRQATAGSNNGESWAVPLTEREREVALLVAQGYANREVAEQLFCSVRTVEVHVGRIYRKLDLRSRFELVVLAHRTNAGP